MMSMKSSVKSVTTEKFSDFGAEEKEVTGIKTGDLRRTRSRSLA